MEHAEDLKKINKKQNCKLNGAHKFSESTIATGSSWG